MSAMPANSQVINATEHLRVALSRFLDARKTLPTLGTYESEFESLNLMNLVIRNIEGCIVLLETDIATFPAGMVLARTALEISFKIMWLLDPTQPLEREARYVAHLKGEVDTLDKLNNRVSMMGGYDVGGALGIRRETEAHRMSVEKSLPSAVTRVSKVPDLFSIMKSVGREHRYTNYILGSQFTHGTYMATGIYREGKGKQMIRGEFLAPAAWYTPLTLCRYSLFDSGHAILDRLGGDCGAFSDDDFESGVRASIDAIKEPD